MKYSALILLSLLISLAACQEEEPTPAPEPSVAVVYDTTAYVLDIGSFPEPHIPEDNQLTQQKVQLGRMLFYEKKLSALDNQSCASCHAQSSGFTDPLQFSVGTFGDVGDRQAMNVMNLAWNSNGFFWDGRSPTIRHQSLEPIQNPIEMAETINNIVAKLSVMERYQDQFIRAFGDEEVTEERIALALEQFMITLVSTDSKYDRYLAGEVPLSPSEERGRELFFAEYNPFFPDVSGADCAHCHSGINFENDQFMNNGLDSDEDFVDLGRYNVTGADEDKAKFKVTSLRNIEVGGPYMHDGRFETLEEVVDHYNEGIVSSSTADITVLNTQETGLMLSEQDKTDLVNFLKTLTDESFLTDPRFSDPF